MDRIIEVKVNGNYLTKDSRIAGVQHEANAKTLRIEFDAGWDGFAKKVTFWDANGLNPVERTLTADLLEDITASTRIYLCPIPGEAMAESGEFTFVIDGYVDGKRQRSISETMDVRYAPFIEEAGAPADPTPTQAEQLQVQIDTLLEDMAAEATTATNAAATATEAADDAKQRATDAAASAVIASVQKDAAVTAKEKAEVAEGNAKAWADGGTLTGDDGIMVDIAGAKYYRNVAKVYAEGGTYDPTPTNGNPVDLVYISGAENMADKSRAYAEGGTYHEYQRLSNMMELVEITVPEANSAKGYAADAKAAAANAASDAAEKTDALLADKVTAAQAAQTAAETAQTAAQAAQTAAETAQGKAEDAQTAAETAQSKAETAEGNAKVWSEGGWITQEDGVRYQTAGAKYYRDVAKVYAEGGTYDPTPTNGNPVDLVYISGAENMADKSRAYAEGGTYHEYQRLSNMMELVEITVPEANSAKGYAADAKASRTAAETAKTNAQAAAEAAATEAAQKTDALLAYKVEAAQAAQTAAEAAQSASEAARDEAKEERAHTMTLYLPTSGWEETAMTQTVSVVGVKADGEGQSIEVWPHEESEEAYHDAGVSCISRDTDSLTFKADSVPASSLKVQILMRTVEQKLRVTVSGSGQGYASVTVNGVSCTSGDELLVEPGTNILCRVTGERSKYIKLNGVTVSNGTYSYTAKKNAAIYMAKSSIKPTNASGQTSLKYYGRITITESDDGLIRNYPISAIGPQGEPGPQGTDGADGQSAYAAAQAGGYTDTQANFYADLAAMQGLASALAAL